MISNHRTVIRTHQKVWHLREEGPFGNTSGGHVRKGNFLLGNARLRGSERPSSFSNEFSDLAELVMGCGGEVRSRSLLKMKVPH